LLNAVIEIVTLQEIALCLEEIRLCPHERRFLCREHSIGPVAGCPKSGRTWNPYSYLDYVFITGW